MRNAHRVTILLIILLIVTLIYLGLNRWLTIAGSYFIGICALIVGFSNRIISYIRKPILKIFFNPDNKEYQHNMLFGILVKIRDPITKKEYRISRPGFNSRVCIQNVGIDPARKAQARIESIKIYNKKRELVEEAIYHPSVIKWSGEKGYTPVDIMGESFFFLDLFYAINETREEIVNFNQRLGNETITELINDFEYSNEIYWNVWIDFSYPRGVREKYDKEGHFELIFIVSSENSNQLRFKAEAEWKKETWNRPIITVTEI